MPFKCDICGKFISHDDLFDGSATIKITPDNEFSSEQTDIMCKKCNKNRMP